MGDLELGSRFPLAARLVCVIVLAAMMLLGMAAVSRAQELVNLTGTWSFPSDANNCYPDNCNASNGEDAFYYLHPYTVGIVDNAGTLTLTPDPGGDEVGPTGSGTESSTGAVRMVFSVYINTVGGATNNYYFSGTAAANGSVVTGPCTSAPTGCFYTDADFNGSQDFRWDMTPYAQKTPTTTTVQCADSGPAPLKCTATVASSSLNAQTPTGTVAFTAASTSFPSGTGKFSAPTCTLVASAGGASCSVNFTPSYSSDPSVQVTGTYSGDGTFATSTGMTDVVPCPYSKTLECDAILVSPSSNLTVGNDVTITGSGWNPKGGSVSLSLPGAGPKFALPPQSVDANGDFTDKFPLEFFNQRSVYPHVSNGCTLSVVATQGSLTAQAQGTSPGIGHVAYADYGTNDSVTGAPPVNTGDVYCLGENPAGIARPQDIVVTVPADRTPPVPGLTAYQVAATPLNINLLGSGDGDAFKPSLFVNGTVCLGLGDGSAIVIKDQVGSLEPCPVAFPGGLDNQAVRAFGNTSDAGSVVARNACVDLAVAGTVTAPLTDQRYAAPIASNRFIGDIDCALQNDVPSLNFTTLLFVDGSLRIANPFVTFSGNLITSGSVAASAGIVTRTPAQVIVGDDALFGIGPPYRGLSPAQKQEIQLLINQYSMQGSMATQYGAILGRPALAASGASVGGAYVSAGLAAKIFRVVGKNPITALVLATVSQILSEVSKQGDDKVHELTALIKDPPDRDFRVIARPAAASGLSTTVRTGKGVSKADARILNKLLSNMTTESEVGAALGTAVNRAGASAQAGDTTAEKLQIAAAVKYALADAKLLTAQPKLLAAAAHVLQSFYIGRAQPTAKGMAAFRLYLKKHGFSAAFARLERKRGVTTQQLNVYRLALLASPVAPRLSIAQIIGAKSFAASDRTAATLLRAFAQAAPATVGLREAFLRSLEAGGSLDHAG